MALKEMWSQEVRVPNHETVGILATNLVSSAGHTTGTVMARLRHKSGGRIRLSCHAVPTSIGGNGEDEFKPGDRWEVWGMPDLLNLKIIAQYGQPDAYILIQGYGAQP